jgi:hypothetical protein
MLPEHTRAGVTHNRSNLLPSGTLITVHRAFDASRLLGAEVAALQPKGSIIPQPLAFGAKRFSRGVMATAIAPNHRHNRLPFPGKTLAGKAWVDCLAVFRRWLHGTGLNGFYTGHR